MTWLIRCTPAIGAHTADGDPGPAATWDAANRTLRLARDRTGLVPLFHARTPDGAVIASPDLDALRRAGAPGEISAETAAAWLAGVPLRPEETLYAGIDRVPAGHVLELSGDDIRIHRAWTPPTPGDRPAADAAQFGEVLEQAAARATGGAAAAVFLSGGIDSSAVAVAATRSTDSLVGLCVDVEGASEDAIQHTVADGLGIRRLTARAAAEPGLLARAVERAATSLWPTAAAWAPVFDDLADRARNEGAEVLLDGQGGDDLLDAGLAAGAELWRHPRELAWWLRAEHRYAGSARSSLRHLLSSARGAQQRYSPPAWVAPAHWNHLADRNATTPKTYAAIRAADLTEGLMAAQREETADRGRRTGLRHAHPLWDPEVVELLHGLPPVAFVHGGHPKSPARAYLRERVPTVVGAWPRPALAGDLLTNLLQIEGKRLWEASDRGASLAALGVIEPGTAFEDFPSGLFWTTICLESWISRR